MHSTMQDVMMHNVIQNKYLSSVFLLKLKNLLITLPIISKIPKAFNIYISVKLIVFIHFQTNGKIFIVFL
ncbi:hypothetical protein BXO88_15130 [Oribacterium sp. C9]|nr:hypothetical protein BXO88_15130 [Oribacterium sp. C9]